MKYRSNADIIYRTYLDPVGGPSEPPNPNACFAFGSRLRRSRRSRRTNKKSKRRSYKRKRRSYKRLKRKSRKY